MAKVKSVAIIGGGAIAESYYLPALCENAAWKPMVWLVEPSDKRRAQLVKQFDLPDGQHLSDAQQLPADLSVGINCTPSHVHLATSLPLLERGVNMIVEKPLSETVDDAAKLVEAAKGRCLLSVNQHRRLAPCNKLIASYIASGKLGRIKAIHWVEGRKFEWPTQSGFNFRRPWVGRPRGAVLDVGVHIIDLLTWWLGEQLTVTSAVMDGFEGPECYAALGLASSTASIDVVISFHNKLSNTFEIVGDAGSIRGGVGDYDQFEFREGQGPWKAIRSKVTTGTMMAADLIANFIAGIETGDELLIDAASTLPTLRAIDEIYRVAVDPLPSCYSEWAA